MTSPARAEQSGKEKNLPAFKPCNTPVLHQPHHHHPIPAMLAHIYCSPHLLSVEHLDQGPRSPPLDIPTLTLATLCSTYLCQCAVTPVFSFFLLSKYRRASCFSFSSFLFCCLLAIIHHTHTHTTYHIPHTHRYCWCCFHRQSRLWTRREREEESIIHTYTHPPSTS